MYSGSFGGAVGVVASSWAGGKYSNAVAKLQAVSGIGDASFGRSLSLAFLAATSKGFKTSRATLMTTSNLDASSALGSEYKNILSS